MLKYTPRPWRIALGINLPFGQINYELHALNNIIKFCLVHMGDKAMLSDGYCRIYKINWR